MISLKELVPNFKIFLDMDGVLCDFDEGFKKYNPLNITFTEYERLYKQKKEEFKIKKEQGNVTGKFTELRNPWEILSRPENGKHFWSELEWLPDGKKLFKYLKSQKLHIEVCSAPDRTFYSVNGKKEWCKRELGAHIKVNLTNPREGEKSIQKVKFAKSKFDILIDDMQKNIDAWNAVGTGIHHVDYENTVKQLNEIINYEN
jgi:hypothetical protein